MFSHILSYSLPRSLCHRKIRAISLSLYKNTRNFTKNTAQVETHSAAHEHTHTLSHTHTRTHTHMHAHGRGKSGSAHRVLQRCKHNHTRTHSHTLTHTHSLTHTRTHAHTHTRKNEISRRAKGELTCCMLAHSIWSPPPKPPPPPALSCLQHTAISRLRRGEWAGRYFFFFCVSDAQQLPVVLEIVCVLQQLPVVLEIVSIKL